MTIVIIGRLGCYQLENKGDGGPEVIAMKRPPKPSQPNYQPERLLKFGRDCKSLTSSVLGYLGLSGAKIQENRSVLSFPFFQSLLLDF
jgi:hypothetical protein